MFNVGSLSMDQAHSQLIFLVTSASAILIRTAAGYCGWWLQTHTHTYTCKCILLGLHWLLK